MKNRRQLTIVGASGSTAVELRRGSLLSFGPDEADLNIEIRKGEVWITAEGDPSDRVLQAGDSLHLHGRRLLAEALSDAEISVA